MRGRNDLVIHGSPDEVAALWRRLGESPPDGWGRDSEVERRLRVGGEGTFCFCRTEAPGRPPAALLLLRRCPQEWHVYRIIPLGRDVLSDEEYNQVLGEFASRCLGPLRGGSAVRSEVLPPGPRLDDYLSVEAAQALRDFSGTANRTSLQPADRQRWQQFVIRAHLDQSILDPAFFEAWLASAGWPEPARQGLVREYEATRSLLRNYDEELRRSCPLWRR
jgi:hypothetical protein